MSSTIDTLNSVVGSGINKVSDDNDIEINYKFALLQISLAQDNQKEAEKIKQKIDQEQTWQSQCATYVEAINSVVAQDDGFCVITPDMYDFYKSIYPDAEALTKVYDGNGNVTGYKCSKNQLENVKGNIDVYTVDNQAVIDLKTKKRDDIQKKLDSERAKSKPNEKKIKDLQNEVDALNKDIDRLTNELNIKDAIHKIYDNSVSYYNISDDIIKLCNELHIAVPTCIMQDGKKYYSNEDLKALANKIKEFGDSLPETIQNDMVYWQNYIGQYNSFLEGAAQTVSNATSWGLNIAKY